MRKNDLVKEIAERLKLPKHQCDQVIDTLAEIVTERLQNGEKVIVRGFVTFEVSERKARDGYNPTTGKIEHYEPVKSVKCKVGKPIKDAINER